jgi:Ca-activated chloride channel family protein
MKLRPLISLLSISLLSLALQKVRAQTAEGFFHTGAQSYLSNNVEGARQEVDKGLKLFPNDVKLQKLDQLLKQQQQQQNQNQQQQQQQQNQSQQKQNQSKQDQEQKQKQDEQQKQQQQKQQQQQKNQQQDQQKQADQQKQKEQQGQPGQMTPDEAKKLLDSQKDDESLLPANQNDKHREKSLKDW